MVERVATPLQNRHGMCRFSLWEKAAFSPKALPLRKQKGSAPSGAGGQTRKHICVQILSGIARKRSSALRKDALHRSGLIRKPKAKSSLFLLHRAGRSSFSRQEKKKRGLQTHPAHAVSEKSPARAAGTRKVSLLFKAIEMRQKSPVRAADEKIKERGHTRPCTADCSEESSSAPASCP